MHNQAKGMQFSRGSSLACLRAVSFPGRRTRETGRTRPGWLIAPPGSPIGRSGRRSAVSQLDHLSRSPPALHTQTCADASGPAKRTRRPIIRSQILILPRDGIKAGQCARASDPTVVTSSPIRYHHHASRRRQVHHTDLQHQLQLPNDYLAHAVL
ncbi:hypothetical protein PYCCODRAFT_825480 [Trametes coccinea BRFM310]|uniref:Uncharacterized protein n=1 Tax=Trametes coccinea (strain BRFM310) TaxID=1353009 RepID=A0A1Y2IGQ3_TRAC3|nr:hypothetical protein PYCCODRAFT_825480 [Trametes coccinea BRFM310]